jgi:hypothetical protein
LLRYHYLSHKHPEFLGRAEIVKTCFLSKLQQLELGNINEDLWNGQAAVCFGLLDNHLKSLQNGCGLYTLLLNVAAMTSANSPNDALTAAQLLLKEIV